MKIALVNPRFHIKAYYFFPLGIGFIAGALEKNRIQYDFYDLHKDWMSIENFISKLSSRASYDIVAITGLITSFPNIVELTTAIRVACPKAKIVLGGKITVLDPQFIFEKIDVDFLVKGEGEVAFLQLIEMLEHKRNINDVQGIAYKNSAGEIVSNGEASLIENISEYFLPLKNPDLGRYVNSGTVQSPGLLSINLVSSRGCPFRCTFCNFSKGPYNRMRYYEVGLLKKYWDKLKNENGLQHVTFNDDIFTVNKPRVHELCNALKESGLRFSCSTRLDCLDEEIISVLDSSGCSYLCIGIESPSPMVSKIIDKRLNLDGYKENIELLKKSNITVNFGFMLGYYGENEKTMAETRRFILENNLIYTAFFATAFPETRLFEMVKDRIDNMEEYLSKLSKVDLSSNYILNMTEMTIDRIYSFRDDLLTDSVLNVMKIPHLLRFPIKPFLLFYLLIMRRYVNRFGILKKIFEHINIVIVKPLVALRN